MLLTFVGIKVPKDGTMFSFITWRRHYHVKNLCATHIEKFLHLPVFIPVTKKVVILAKKLKIGYFVRNYFSRDDTRVEYIDN